MPCRRPVRGLTGMTRPRTGAVAPAPGAQDSLLVSVPAYGVPVTVLHVPGSSPVTRSPRPAWVPVTTLPLMVSDTPNLGASGRGAAERLILFLTDVLVTGDLAAATGFVAGHPLVAAQQGAGHLAATQGRGHTDLDWRRFRARRPLRRRIGSTGGRPPGTRFHTGHPGRPIDVAAADLATATGSGGRDLGRRRLRRDAAELAE